MKGKISSKLKKSLAGVLAVVTTVAMLVPAGVTTFAATAPDEAVSIDDVVATITSDGTTYEYGSLQDAFDHAEEDDTVVLVKDVLLDEEEYVTLDQAIAITLDLDGNEIVGTAADNAIVSVDADATLTVTGSGAITNNADDGVVLGGTAGALEVEGIADIYGELGDIVVAYCGTYNVDPTAYVPEGYGFVLNDDETYSVGWVTPVWTWTDADSDDEDPTCTVNLVINEYGSTKSVTGGAVDAVVAGPTTLEPTTTAGGYDYYTASVTVADVIADGNYANAEEYVTNDPTTYAAGEEIWWYVVPGSETEPLDHDYEITNVAFVKSAGKVVKDADGNRIYTATLTDNADDTVTTITGAVSETVDEIISFTDKDGNIIKTQTTAVVEGTTTEATCYQTGKGTTFTIDIFASDDTELDADITVEDETTTIAKLDHDYTLTADNVYMVWVYTDANGNEKEVAELPADVIAALTPESTLTYRVYAKCAWYDTCEKTSLLEEEEVEAEVTEPYVKANGTLVDGSAVYAASYTYSYTADNGTTARKEVTLDSIEFTIAGEEDVTASDGNDYTAYIPGLVTFDESKDYEIICLPTCEAVGIEQGYIKTVSSSGVVTYVQKYQQIAKTDHTWKLVDHVDATVDADGYDIYKCTNKDADGTRIHTTLLHSYNGETEPAVWSDTNECYEVGSDGGSDSIYPALGYLFKVAVDNRGKDKVVYTAATDDDPASLTITYLWKTNTSSSSYKNAQTVTIKYIADDGEDDEVTLTAGAATGTFNIYNCLEVEDPDDLACTEKVKAIVTNAVYGDYTYTTSVKGTNHGSYTGTVVWAEDGTASVNIVCDECGEVVDTTGITVTAGETVDPTCTEDGYTNYEATYTGSLKNVTLENTTYKGSLVPAPGHTYDDPATFVVTENEDGTYSAMAWCTVCEAPVDTVVAVKGPVVQTDGTRKLQLTYTNGLAESQIYYSGLLKETVTLIDHGEAELVQTETLKADDRYVYGEWTDVSVFEIVDSVTLENDEEIDDYEFFITDSEGNEIVAPDDEDDAAALPAGTYTVTIYGVDGYAGTIIKEFTIISSSAIDYVPHVYVDAELVDDGAYTVTYDGNDHSLIGFAFTEEPTEYEMNIDDDVTVLYSVNGSLASEEIPSYSEAGTYNVTVYFIKENYQPQTMDVVFTIAPYPVTVAIDNAETTEGTAPSIVYQLLNADGTVFTDEEVLGLNITTAAGEALDENLKAGVYTLAATFTNANYAATVVGGYNWGGVPTLTVIAAEPVVLNGWVSEADPVTGETIWFYYDNGVMYKGWFYDNNYKRWFYLDEETGVMHTGWTKVDGLWYYLYKGGSKAEGGWLLDNGVWYYLDSAKGVGGAMLANEWKQIDGKWYFFKSNGAMCTNEWYGGYWFNANGSWTYKPLGSWKKNNQGWWFGDTSGWYAKNGSYLINNVWYDFDTNGYWVEK